MTAEPQPNENTAELMPHETGRVTEVDDRTVYERMWSVLAELPPIGKTQHNSGQNFMFRGHDDVLNALNPLLSRHGLFIVPRAIERIVGERQTDKGKTMYEVNVLVEFTVYGAKGDFLVGAAWGEGTDMGDKATSKAHTMALKTMLAQTFAVSTEENFDPDSGSPEHTTRGARQQTKSRGRDRQPAPEQHAKSWAEWTTRLAELGVPPDESSIWLRQAVAGLKGDPTTDEGKVETFRCANVALGTLIGFGDLAFQTGARSVISQAFGTAFGWAEGVTPAGPEWRLDPTETDLPVKPGSEPEPVQTELTPEEQAQADDIPFGEEAS